MELGELKNLNNLMSSIIDSSDWLLELSEKIFEIGFPDTQEKYRFCSEYFHYDDNWEEYLAAIRQIHPSQVDFDEFYPLLDSAHDTVLHAISVSIMIGNLKWFLTDSHDAKCRKFTEILFPLTQACYPLECCLSRLKEQYKKKAGIWDQIPDKNDDDEDDPDQLSILPEPLLEHDSYISILQSITLIRRYCKNQSPKQIEFFLFLTEQLNSFAEGKEFEEFSFSLVLKENKDIQYLEFHGDGICVSVTDAGYTYDPSVGGDSYTNWEYTIWRNGQDEGSLNLDEDKILELIQMNAKFSIESPDRFIETDADD